MGLNFIELVIRAYQADMLTLLALLMACGVAVWALEKLAKQMGSY